MGANGTTGELRAACRTLCLGANEGGCVLKPKSIVRGRKPCSWLSLYCRHNRQVAGAGGEILAPRNDRGAPGAFSSSAKPPHPFLPLLLPVLSRRVYNLRHKPVFGLVLARLQAAQGPWPGQPCWLPWTPPLARPASLLVAPSPLGHRCLPTVCPIPFPQLNPWPCFAYQQKIPRLLASAWQGKAPSRLQLVTTPFSDLGSTTSLPCFQLLNNIPNIPRRNNILLALQLPNASSVPTPACQVHGSPAHSPTWQCLLLSQSPLGTHKLC